MSRALRYLLYLCAAAVMLATFSALGLRAVGLPTYPVHAPRLVVAATPARVAEGRRLVTMMCVGCHEDRATGTLSGQPVKDVPGIFGRFYSANITGDPAHGIGAWTDGELAHLLRTGIRRDGRLAIVMPAFPGLADEDLLSIVAFLRSEDPLVSPTPVDSRPPDPTPFGVAIARVAFKPHAMPSAEIRMPPPSDRVAFGRYLAIDRFQCYDCHSASFTTNDHERPERSVGFLGGGTELTDADGNPIYSPNITADVETGIGRWSEADFVRAIKGGLRPDRTPLRSPMSLVPEMQDDEASAIYAYLRTVPVLRNPRRLGPQPQPAAPAGAATGGAVFQKYCVACHGLNGRQTFDITRASRDFRTLEELEAWIRRPAAFRPDAKMPAWGDILREDEINAVAGYVRELQQKAAERQ